MDVVDVKLAGHPLPEHFTGREAAVDGSILGEEPPTRALVVSLREDRHPVLRVLARMPVTAWRQPVVRAAVRRGASAVALSVAAQLAGRWVARRSARNMAVGQALPMLGNLLEQPPQGLQRRRRRGASISETFIYIRRYEDR